MIKKNITLFIRVKVNKKGGANTHFIQPFFTESNFFEEGSVAEIKK